MKSTEAYDNMYVKAIFTGIDLEIKDIKMEFHD